jgi:hypothetical protein
MKKFLFTGSMSRQAPEAETMLRWLVDGVNVKFGDAPSDPELLNWTWVSEPAAEAVTACHVAVVADVAIRACPGVGGAAAPTPTGDPVVASPVAAPPPDGAHVRFPEPSLVRTPEAAPLTGHEA